MNAREFANGVLRDVKLRFPDLYRERIKGRRDEFIAEGAPSESTEGEKVGYVNKDLRLLWVLGTMLRETADDLILRLEDEENRDLSNVCRATGGVAQYTMGQLCWLAFWQFVENRFGHLHKDDGYALNSDWSVVRASRSLSKGTSKLGLLSDMARTQANAAGSIDWMAARIEKERRQAVRGRG